MHCSLLEGGILDMHIWDSAQLVLAENEAFFFLHLPSSHVSWLEIIFFIKRRLLLLLWEVQDLTLETCLYRHAVRSRLFIMIQDHYYTPTTPFSLWPNEVILIWVELNRGSVWVKNLFERFRRFYPTQEVTTGELEKVQPVQVNGHLNRLSQGSTWKRWHFQVCCQRGWQMEWTLPADVQDTEQEPRSENRFTNRSTSSCLFNTYKHLFKPFFHEKVEQLWQQSPALTLTKRFLTFLSLHVVPQIFGALAPH